MKKMAKPQLTAIGEFVGVHPVFSSKGTVEGWACVAYTLRGEWRSSSQHETREAAVAERSRLFKIARDLAKQYPQHFRSKT